jgi:ATP-dependent Clp protease ATP-binding subunit ClpX
MELSQECIVCGLPEHQVAHMIEINENIFLCNVCTAEISGVFAREMRKQKEPESITETKKMYPKQIKQFLDDYVIGQDQAKKVLSVEIYNHFNRINNTQLEIQKNNILMVGPSGSGKTLLVQTIAKMLDLPLAIIDCTQLSQAGYKGSDTEDILKQIILAADGDIKKAETGIVFLDEFDKIAKRNNDMLERDPTGSGVQHELLRMVEGHKYQIKLEGVRENKSSMDTTNILFICAGAFSGLNQILEKNRMDKNYGIGFSASVDKPEIENDVEVTPEDLIEYGIITEIVSRLHVTVKLNELTKEDYRRILLDSKNSVIKQYQKLLKIDDIDLSFSEIFIDEVVDKVYNSKKGARGLRTEIEKSVREIIFDIDTVEKVIEI